MIEVTGLVYLVFVGYLGASGLPWVYVPALAVGNFILYALLRATLILQTMQERHPVQGLVFIYIGSAVTAAVFFGIGRLVGMFL